MGVWPFRNFPASSRCVAITWSSSPQFFCWWILHPFPPFAQRGGGVYLVWWISNARLALASLLNLPQQEPGEEPEFLVRPCHRRRTGTDLRSRPIVLYAGDLRV